MADPGGHPPASPAGADEAYRLLFEHAADGMLVQDFEGVILDANLAACALLRYEPGDLVGVRVSDLVHASDLARSPLRVVAVRAGHAVVAERRLERHGGGLVEVEMHTRSLPDGRVLTMIRDLSLRRRIERQVASIAHSVSELTGEDYLRSLVTHLCDVFAADLALVGELLADGDAIRVLSAYRDGAPQASWEYPLAGTPCATVVGQQVCCYPRGVWRKFPADAALSAMEAESYVGTPLFASSGVPLGLVAVVSRRAIDDPEFAKNVLAIFASRAAAELERRSTERQLRESESRFRGLFEQAAVGMAHLSPSGVILRVNEQLCRLAGRRAEEVVGQPFEALALEEAGAALRQEGARLMAGAVDRVVTERQFRRKDGQVIWGRVTLSLQRGADAQPAYVIAVVEDVTARRRAEEDLQFTQSQLVQAQKMEAIGRLAGGVAHDFNNVLNVILGYGGLVFEALAPDDPLRDDVRQIVTAGERAAGLTRQLLTFSRKQVVEPRVVSLTQVVGETRRMLERLVGEDVTLDLAIDTALGLVRLDPNQFTQVLINLAVNARDAMPAGGLLRIALDNATLDAPLPGVFDSVPPGEYVVLTVADSGVGIDEASQQRIFEPFFTTKPKDKGTGLGLSMVYGIVRQCRGYIWLQSTPGRGTRFRVYLPRVDAEPSTESPDTAVAPLGMPFTLLLAEDEDALRVLLTRTLERAGYRVIAGRTGQEALERARAHDGPIDLLLTDVMMPGMNGRELADRLRADRPGLRTLFMSGYLDDTISQSGVLDEGVRLLHKPVSPTQVLHAIGEAIRAR